MTINLEVTDWVEWTGGENPVPGQRVEVRWGDGHPATTMTSDNGDWQARHGEYIIAYRVVSPTPASAAKGDEPFAYIGWDIVCDWRREPDTHGRRLYLWREPEHGRVPLFLDQSHPSQQAGMEGGWIKAADRPDTKGDLWLAANNRGQVWPGVFVNHRIPEDAAFVQRIILPDLAALNRSEARG